MIELSQLTKRYGQFTAVAGIDLTIPKGELYGLLGPNGAGKTTTMRMIAGILQPTSGTVRIAGIGQGADSIAVRYRSDLTSFRATQSAAEAAYRMAGFGAARVEVAEIHDAFTPFELISLEDTGLVPSGKAGRATLDGETAIGGRLPVNPSGGLKARGHPLAATGVSQIVELVWQLRGLAEGRQVDARIGLVRIR